MKCYEEVYGIWKSIAITLRLCLSKKSPLSSNRTIPGLKISKVRNLCRYTLISNYLRQIRTFNEVKSDLQKNELSQTCHSHTAVGIAYHYTKPTRCMEIKKCIQVRSIEDGTYLLYLVGEEWAKHVPRTILLL